MPEVVWAERGADEARNRAVKSEPGAIVLVRSPESGNVATFDARFLALASDSVVFQFVGSHANWHEV